jgi:hypothetical protein
LIDKDEIYNTAQSKNFKFLDLKVYASTEWLANNKKKYRQVFDRYEAAFIYAELSLFNKMFDVEDWDIDVEFKCFSLNEELTELCSLSFQRKVSKDDPIFYVREGWGNKEKGKFWQKGTYYWDAYVNGEKIAMKYFYIEDAGRELTYEDNPYFEINSIQLYEGPFEDISKRKRQYFSKFHGAETRYVYAEITLTNLNLAENWQCELTTKFHNNTLELKGEIVRLHEVIRNEKDIIITIGWGSNVKGSWHNDRFTCEIVFMEKLVAVIPFEIADTFEIDTKSFVQSNQPNVMSTYLLRLKKFIK